MELTLRRQLCGAKQNKKQTLLDTDADRSSYLVSKYKGEGQACIGDHFSASRSANDSRDDDAFDRYGQHSLPFVRSRNTVTLERDSAIDGSRSRFFASTDEPTSGDRPTVRYSSRTAAPSLLA